MAQVPMSRLVVGGKVAGEDRAADLNGGLTGALARVVVAALVLAPLLLLGPLALRANEGKTPPAPSANLAVPASLSDKARAAFDSALSDTKAALKSGREKQLSKAISSMRGMVRQAKDEALPHFYLGLLYTHTQDYRKARESLQSAISLNPRFHEAHTKLGDVEWADSSVAAAIPFYEKALEIQPDDEEALDSLLVALTRYGRYQDAKMILERALKLGKTPLRERCEKSIDLVTSGPRWPGNTHTVETTNYIVKTNVSAEFTQIIADELELIRAVYDSLFPDIEKPDQKYPVFVFDSASSYTAAGSPPNTYGFYDPLFRRLMLYQQEELEGTLMTLRHEGFHQYCDDYSNSIPQWFNEGLADYFAPAQRVPGKKQVRIGPNPRRLGPIAEIIQHNANPSVSELLNMSYEQMYHPVRIGIHYAQAWSIVYFCIDGGNSTYQKTLVNYFKALRKGKNQYDTYLLTFGKLDMDRFEREWRNFTVKIALEQQKRGR